MDFVIYTRRANSEWDASIFADRNNITAWTLFILFSHHFDCKCIVGRFVANKHRHKLYKWTVFIFSLYSFRKIVLNFFSVRLMPSFVFQLHLHLLVVCLIHWNLMEKKQRIRKQHVFVIPFVDSLSLFGYCLYIAFLPSSLIKILYMCFCFQCNAKSRI